MSYTDDVWKVKQSPFRYVSEIEEDKPAFYYIRKKKEG